MSRNRACIVAVAAGVLGVGSIAARADVTYIDLYTLGLPAGYSSASPSGGPIGAGGQIAGFAVAPSGANHALL